MLPNRQLNSRLPVSRIAQYYALATMQHCQVNRLTLFAIVLFIVTCGSGCSVWRLANRTMYSELSLFPPITDGYASCRQYNAWARESWTRISQEEPDLPASYARGFRQGFVDYVYAGGTGEPPPVPPRPFWRINFRNKLGDQAIRDWYVGYRHGAAVARDDGYRDRAVIPSSELLGSGSPAKDEPLHTFSVPSEALPLESPSIDWENVPVPEGTTDPNPPLPSPTDLRKNMSAR